MSAFRTFDCGGSGVAVGYLPIALRNNSGESAVTWMDCSGATLREPFFYDTVALLKGAYPPPMEVRTSVSELIDIARQRKSVTPKGLIFHLSRCGSTLIANACRLGHGVRVISEAPVIAGVFEPPVESRSYANQSKGAESCGRLLESLARIFASHNGGCEGLVIKFSSWNLMFMSLVRTVWPQVPCVIVTRNPIEILVSHIWGPANWMYFKSHPEEACSIFRWMLSSSTVVEMPLTEFLSRIIGTLCDAAAEHWDEECYLLDYGQIDVDVMVDVGRLFGIDLETRRNGLTELLGYYSKDRHQAASFKPDRQTKLDSATQAMKYAVRLWAQSSYERLQQVCGHQAWPKIYL